MPVEYQHVPEASPGSVAAVPASRSVRKSCGSRTAAAASAFAGSFSRSQRHFEAVMDATGTVPVRAVQASGPPSAAVSAAACGAERVSFHSSAGRSGRPDRSSTTRPCCCPATAIPVTEDAERPDSLSPPVTASHRARHQTSGSLSRAPPSPVTTCGARPTASSSPVTVSTTAALVDWVELSTPMTTVRGGMGYLFLASSF